MLLTSLDRRVLGSLRSKDLRRPGSRPRIAVVANCQSFGIAYAMKLLNINATVHRFPVLFKSWVSGKMLARALKLYDYVFFQPFGPGYVRASAWEPIVAELKSPILLPTLVFTAYHPDQIHVHDSAKSGEVIGGPMGPYQSALAFFAYRAGFPVSAALKLFDPDVFETVGYFDLWNDAVDTFLEEGKKFGLDFREDILRWTRRGCFMYSSLHPKPFVFVDYARQLMKKAGIPTTPVNFDDYAIDDLVRGAVYPVYPEIAQHYGIQGSYVFKGANYSFELGLGDFWDLRGFVTECYRIYAKRKPEQLTNERVGAWLADAELSAYLRSVAQPRAAARASDPATPRSGIGLAAPAALG